MGSRAAATAPLTDITALAGDCGAAGGARSVTKIQTWMEVMQCRRVYFVDSSLWPIRSLPSKLVGWKKRANISGRDRI